MTLLFLFYSAIYIHTVHGSVCWCVCVPVCERRTFSLSLSLTRFFSVLLSFVRIYALIFLVAILLLHKPIMVSVRHAAATNDDAIIHIAAMPSV